MKSKRAVLVDRDDTLCPDVPYCSDPADMHAFPDVPASVKRLNDAGYLVLMVTNQSGIGRGYFTLEQLNAVNAELLSQISAGGGRIDDIFFCPHRPEDNCDCRKPKTKMGLQAIEKYGLDPAECWMVGDHDKDIEFGRQLGMRTVKVSAETSFSDAVDIILSEGAKSQNNPNNREETY
ncbi:MAG: HAD family hydrolase [Candidatus Methanomethylophilus sp.]|nr:HAD family hydrolase [Methanomethylophilus sp.]